MQLSNETKHIITNGFEKLLGEIEQSITTALAEEGCSEPDDQILDEQFHASIALLQSKLNNYSGE